MTKPPAQHDEKSEMVLMQIAAKDGRPSLAAAAEQLGLAPADLDADYGVVAVDLMQGHYVVRVRGDRVPDGYFSAEHGPFSNPKISTFGPRIKK